jgi:translation initiation factor IF-3
MIRVPRVFLIDENNEKVGEVDTIEAKRRADSAGLDLVEIAPDNRPPVCRILDYGKFKYEQAKKDRASKAKSKTAEMKEVRLGRSMKIDPHDVQIRMTQARKFLIEGHKVQIVQNFRGREMMHKDRAYARMREITDELADIAKAETSPRMMGKRMSMIFAPDKSKVDQYKRKLEKEAKLRAQEQAAAPAGESPAEAAAPVAETPPPKKVVRKREHATIPPDDEK